MNQLPKDLDEKAYNDVFDFLLGFLLLPFISFLMIVSIHLVLKPKAITDGIALIYIALLTGIYRMFLMNEKSVVYLAKPGKTSKPRLVGVLLFVVLVLAFYKSIGINVFL